MGVVALLLPARHQIVSGCHHFEHARQFVWVILKIPIHSDDDFSNSNIDTCHQGGGLAKIAPEPEGPNFAVLLGKFLHLVPCAVGAAVVDKNDVGYAEAV